MATDALSPAALREEARRFLAEDVGTGDITTEWTVPADAVATAWIVAREACVVAGLDIARLVFHELDGRLAATAEMADGAAVEAGARLLRLAGDARPILTGERVALNLLQRMSGIATVTRRYVEALAGTGASVSDTRKTTPGLRQLEKYAVRMGGGRNHRVGLFDAVLIKDNHIAAAGGIGSALRSVLEHRNRDVPVQIEVDSLDQLSEALDIGVDAVLLDNMPPAQVAAAVARIRSTPAGASCWIEASGGITLANIRAYGEAGVDTISVGALTHSAPSVDIALDFDV
ncbi:MAG TPA: carboxylating nicotinate-nucleotide diphosphorylase [Vicinamibacterales bacterium]|jgi:nicotinate-nucleotide pyrophosphorylase (carboxylating)